MFSRCSSNLTVLIRFSAVLIYARKPIATLIAATRKSSVIASHPVIWPQAHLLHKRSVRGSSKRRACSRFSVLLTAFNFRPIEEGDELMSSKPDKERTREDMETTKDLPGQNRQPEQGQTGQPQRKDDRLGQQGGRSGEQRGGQR